MGKPDRTCFGTGMCLHIGSCCDFWADDGMCVCDPADAASYLQDERLYVAVNISGFSSPNIRTIFPGGGEDVCDLNSGWTYAWLYWDWGSDTFGTVKFELRDGTSVKATRSTEITKLTAPELTEGEIWCEIFDLRTAAEGTAPYTAKIRIHLDMKSTHPWAYRPGITVNGKYIPLRDVSSQNVNYNNPPTAGTEQEYLASEGRKLHFVNITFDDPGTYQISAKYAYGCDPLAVVVGEESRTISEFTVPASAAPGATVQVSAVANNDMSGAVPQSSMDFYMGGVRVARSPSNTSNAYVIGARSSRTFTASFVMPADGGDIEARWMQDSEHWLPEYVVVVATAKKNIAMLSDPCEGVTCENVCVGADLWSQKCVNSVCMADALLIANCPDCPGYVPPVCNEGEKRYPQTCWDQSQVMTEVCIDNTWVPSGELCRVRLPQRTVMMAAPNIVYEGQAFDIVCQIFCGAALSQGEPVTLRIDGAEVDTKITSAGEVKFRWTAEGVGMRRITADIPVNSNCAVPGHASKTIMVSAYVEGIMGQIKAEREAYETGLEALRKLKKAEKAEIIGRASQGTVVIPASLAGTIIEIGGVPTTIPEGGLVVQLPSGESIITIIDEGIRTNVPVILLPGEVITLPTLPGGL